MSGKKLPFPFQYEQSSDMGYPVPTGHVPRPTAAPYCLTCLKSHTECKCLQTTREHYDTTRPAECQNPNLGGLARPDRHNEGAAPLGLDGPGVSPPPSRSGGYAIKLYVVRSVHTTPCSDQGEGGFLELVVSYKVAQASLVETLAYIVDKSGVGR